MVILSEKTVINFSEIKKELESNIVEDKDNYKILNIFYNTRSTSNSYEEFIKYENELIKDSSYFKIYIIKNDISIYIGTLECTKNNIYNILTLLSQENMYRTMYLKDVNDYILKNKISNYKLFY